jgi:hypothetical protein
LGIATNLGFNKPAAASRCARSKRQYCLTSSQTLPGVRNAVEQNHCQDGKEYIAITAGALNAYCARLESATALLA